MSNITLQEEHNGREENTLLTEKLNESLIDDTYETLGAALDDIGVGQENYGKYLFQGTATKHGMEREIMLANKSSLKDVTNIKVLNNTIGG